MVKTNCKTRKLIDNPTLHVPAMFAACDKILIFSLLFNGMITNPNIDNQYY